MLHADGPSGAWGNLGLWRDDPTDYAGACTALAQAVAAAAGLRGGDRVLAVACGAGEELLLWQALGAAEVVAVEQDPTRARAARARAPGARVLEGSGAALAQLGLPAGHFDRVLCVDAAYHLSPRLAFLQGAWTLLRPGGTLAYTDLVAARPRPLLRAAARLCALDPADVLASEDTQRRRLLASGFADARFERLDEAVLGGFARFVQHQRVAPWRWPRVAVTAALIGPCRAAGLGYAMLAARRPLASGTAGAASTQAAAASAERTALSSSGTPGIA